MEYYSYFKWNELSHNGKTWRGFKCLLVSERSQFEKAVYSMIPSIWHFGKGKIMESVKGWVVARVWVGKDEYREHRGFGGGGGSETSIGCICHYPFFSKLIGGPHQEWTLMKAMAFGWQWCINVGSSVVANTSLCWWMGRVGEAVAVNVVRGCMRNLCTFPSILLWTHNCSKTQSLFLKAPKSPSTQAGKSDVILATPIPLLTSLILKTCEFHHQTLSPASILPHKSHLLNGNDLTSFIPHLPKRKGDLLKAYTMSLHVTAVRIKLSILIPVSKPQSEPFHELPSSASSFWLLVLLAMLQTHWPPQHLKDAKVISA